MKRFLRSVKHASHGIGYTLTHERNFRLELIIGVFTTVLMFALPLTREERMIVVLVMVCVFVLELINTSVERIVDILKPRIHPYARIAKDVMAAAVLISALGAAIIGVSIFYPYIRVLL